MGQLGKAIAAGGQFTVNYGESLLKGVTKEMAARQPTIDGKVVKCNHATWVYGHLAGYSSRMCELLEIQPGPTAKPAGWDDLFKNGTECKDDPAGTIYPPFEAIAKHFLEGHRYVLSKLPEVSDAVLAKENPGTGRFKEMFPTIGDAMIFMMSGHPMSHLGQASTWRRCMGLPAA